MILGDKNEEMKNLDAVTVKKEKFRIDFIDDLVLQMRLEMTGYDINEGKFQPVAGCVLEQVCESEGRFIKRQCRMGKLVYGAEGSEALEGRLGTPLLHLVFLEKRIGQVLELQHSLPIKRCDNKCV